MRAALQIPIQPANDLRMAASVTVSINCFPSALAPAEPGSHTLLDHFQGDLLRASEGLPIALNYSRFRELLRLAWSVGTSGNNGRGPRHSADSGGIEQRC